jgi:hypothetical protein
VPEPVHILIQRLAAAGFGVYSTRWQDRHELTILNLTAARSGFTFTGDGCARWGYEPATGPGAATLTAVIVHILGAPHTADTTPGAAAYRAFPVKGAVGRCLQDRGLTVTLQVSADWESFEATTEIEVTSPAQPWLGTVHLADDGHLDWGMRLPRRLPRQPQPHGRRDRPHPPRPPMHPATRYPPPGKLTGYRLTHQRGGQRLPKYRRCRRMPRPAGTGKKQAEQDQERP